MLFILYFVSDPESKSVRESESIRSPESDPESVSERPHHDSTCLISTLMTELVGGVCEKHCESFQILNVMLNLPRQKKFNVKPLD